MEDCVAGPGEQEPEGTGHPAGTPGEVGPCRDFTAAEPWRQTAPPKLRAKNKQTNSSLGYQASCCSSHLPVYCFPLAFIYFVLVSGV